MERKNIGHSLQLMFLWFVVFFITMSTVSNTQAGGPPFVYMIPEDATNIGLWMTGGGGRGSSGVGGEAGEQKHVLLPLKEGQFQLTVQFIPSSIEGQGDDVVATTANGTTLRAKGGAPGARVTDAESTDLFIDAQV